MLACEPSYSIDGAWFVQGSAETGTWVPGGMTFYLQNVTDGKPLTSENTLATVVRRMEKK